MARLWFGCAAGALLTTYLARRFRLTGAVLTASAGFSTFLAVLGLWATLQQGWEDDVHAKMTPDARVWREATRLPWEILSIVLLLVCVVVFAATLHTVWSERRQ